MNHHLEQRDGGDADVFKVLRVSAPGLSILNSVKLSSVIVVECVASRIDKLNGVFKLWS